MTLLNPIHPGEMLREDVIKYLDLIIKETAERLRVSRSMLSRVVNCKEGISLDSAIRLELAGVRTARAWLAMQTKYDLAQAKKLPRFPVRALEDAVAA